MTTPRCDEFRERLDDLAGGYLDEQTARAVGEHLATCSDCRREERALRRLLDDAAALDLPIAPPPRVWDRIDGRIDALEAAATSRRATIARSPAVRGLVAAGFVVAIGLAWWAGRESGLRRGTSDGPPAGASLSAEPASGGAPAATGRASAVDPACSNAAAAFLDVKRQLLDALDEQRPTMPAGTVAMVDRNLLTIEAAIEEICRALAQDPGNLELNRMLMAAHQRELDFLQRMTRRTVRL